MFEKHAKVVNFNTVINDMYMRKLSTDFSFSGVSGQYVSPISIAQKYTSELTKGIQSQLGGRWQGFIKQVGFQKGLGAIWKSKNFRWGAFGAVGALSGVYSLSKGLMSSLRWTQRREVQQRGMGFGPGFITWSKRKGMPAQHAGTQDLTDSLHRLRHTSII
jgi:hypothetical protein